MKEDLPVPFLFTRVENTSVIISHSGYALCSSGGRTPPQNKSKPRQSMILHADCYNQTPIAWHLVAVPVKTEECLEG